MGSIFDDAAADLLGAAKPRADRDSADKAETPATQVELIPAATAEPAPASASAEPEDRRSQPRQRPEDLLTDLNEAQAVAVSHRGTPLLVVAGAGSGKTRVLTRRIAHLLATGDARVGQILAITFTNKAAAEMRERVIELVGASAQYMWVSTFHSACVRILRRESKRLGIASNFSIYDSADSQRLIALSVKELNLDIKRFTPRGVAARISAAKNELVDHEEFAAQVSRAAEEQPDPYSEGVAAIYSEYQRRLTVASAMDFDDLIGNTVALL